MQQRERYRDDIILNRSFAARMANFIGSEERNRLNKLAMGITAMTHLMFVFVIGAMFGACFGYMVASVFTLAD